MVKSTRSIIMVSGATVAILALVLSSFQSTFFMQSQIAAAAQDTSIPLETLGVYPSPKLTQVQETAIITAAMNVPELREWSAAGWKFVSMDFVGVTEPELQWQTAIVHLQLPPGVGNTPVDCDQGWWATIDVDMQTYAVKEVGVPTVENNQCHSSIILADPDDVRSEEQFPWFVPTASAVPTNPGFLLMEEDDVTSYDIYGNLAYFKTPAFNSAIYSHMDYYIGELINWKSSTGYLEQEGWLITTIAGCTSCGSESIPADSAVLVYADESVFGNLEARKIPGSGFTWVNDRQMLGETLCNGGTKYIQAVGYGSSIWNHNTNINCTVKDNNNKVSNSGFFENWNTVPSSDWAGDVTGTVSMYSAYEGRGATNTWYTWINSTNEKQTCSGSRSSTTAISGSLAGGNTATLALSGVPVAC